MQLTEYHAEKLQLTTINETSPDVTKVVFPNGLENYIFMARKNIKCPRLRVLHDCVSHHCRMELNQLLAKLVSKNCLVKDDLGGGRYVASGYGNMGKNVHPSLRPPNQPALRKCLKFSEHDKLATITGVIFYNISECINTHCKEVYDDNQVLMKLNSNMAWPPLKYQTSKWK